MNQLVLRIFLFLQVWPQIQRADPGDRRPLHGILLGPLLCQLVVFFAVSFEDAGDLRDKGIVRVGVTEQGADREQNLADRQSWGPLGPKDVEADGPIGVDVGMVDPRCEGYLWRLEGVVSRKVNCEEEHSPLVRAVWGAHDCGLPVEQILSNWSSTALGRGVPSEVLQLLVDPLEGHGDFRLFLGSK